MNIFFDIETIPQQPERETKIEIAKTISAPSTMSVQSTIDAWHNGEGKYKGAKEEAIEKAYRNTSFDAAKGQICSIAWAVGNNEIHQCSSVGITEEDLLRFFFDSLLIELDKDVPFFIGHYIGQFDLKFIWQRAVILGVKPPFALPFDGWHGSDYYCTMSAWAGKKSNSISMDNLAKALGIEGKGDMDGSMVWDAWRNKEFDKIATYNIDDVRIVREIHKKLTFGA